MVEKARLNTILSPRSPTLGSQGGESGFFEESVLR